MSDILTGTPPSLTYLHSAVQDAWAVVWVTVASGLGVLLAWAGISIIFREHLGSQSGWRELVPRLMLGVVAASTSLWWGSFVIDLADSLSRFVAVLLGGRASCWRWWPTASCSSSSTRPSAAR